ncbi:hypothetical protein CC85DRAFT_326861 [Cutaneotrichosporon oleaginosum]|uniref:ferric-chelate reductase (NADPH) n=1 Tax=Cutaneotrichosporon oleaginosum TaxID=879819 RepID=A0A0J1B863_9TREE|nr:uncharacterized protein CC85DRAFT_326861 [Cutaneotrichosporon oleaginosum]KLT43959.1 hypothetical protein CC85DRAFT_326861 [Cutaneotrichosporon oleaginosum]TXT04094.1 hypothetical protein COLE_07791 [Cutaneotrichosporon oleaginosum]
MGILIPAQIAAAQCIVHASPRAAGRGAACLDAVSLLRFADDLYTLRSKLAMVSVVACYDAYVPGHDGRKGWAELGAYFAKFTHTALPDMSVFRANSTMETVNVMFRAGETFSSPVLVARDNWEAGVRTEAEWDRQIYLIALYLVINVIWSCLGYRTANDNLFFPGRRDKQLARFVADRTGIMSFYNLPLLFLLAGRNDLLIWLTGWSYASCTLWHRWVARVATLQAIVHSVAYTWLEGERLAARWTEDPWRTGVVATIVMALMLPFAIRPLRERAYEAFLAVHIILSLVLLVLLFLHVRNFGTGYHAYLWACVGIWVFDRAARLTRVLFLTPTFKPNALALLPNPHGFVRLAIRTPRTLSPSPGSYFFLHLPSISPLANHPFTLASYRRTGAGGTELHFLCKPRGGSTSLLRASVERALANAIPHDLGALKLAVLLEGPYGVSHRLDRFDRVLLVAGGSGITALLPYIPLRECVSVVWMVQDAAQAEDVLVNELRQSAIGAALVDVWVTGSTTPSACLSRWPLGPPVPPPRAPSPEFPCPAAFSGYRCSYNSHMYRPTLSSPDAQHVLGGYTVVEKGRGECNGRVRVRWGRPCVTEILERHLHLEHSRLAILACGPDGMMDDMRAAVAAAYGRVGGDQMEYFEEAFSW